MTDETDQVLAARAAAGDRAAFACLLDRHYGRLHALAWRWMGSRDRAEDVAQEVCLKLATAIRSYRGEAAFSTWLYRLAYTTAIDTLRSRQRIVPLETSHMAALVKRPGGDEPDAIVEGQELWAAVRALPGQQRDAVLLVYGEDLSHAEAAAIMGCTEKTVSWHLHEARKRLKALLEDVA